MVDLVINNMAWAGNYTSIDYSQIIPFNDPKYYHPFRLTSDDLFNATCEIDVSNGPMANVCVSLLIPVISAGLEMRSSLFPTLEPKMKRFRQCW